MKSQFAANRTLSAAREGSTPKRPERWSGLAIWTIVVWLCLTASAQAYVLYGDHVLELMTATLGRAQRLRVHQRLTLYDPGGLSPIRHGREIASYRIPDRYHARFEHPEVQRVHVRAGEATLTLIDGEVANEGETRFDLYKDLMLYRSRRLLADRLRRRGLAVEVSSLGRFQGHLAYVLGARYPDESKTQLWVDKNLFRPLRWIVSPQNTEGRDALEIRYLEWRQFGRIWYPMVVQYYQNGRLVRVVQAERVEVDPPLERDLFDLTRLLPERRPPTPAGETTANEAEAAGEIQQTINEFKRIYE